MTYNEKLFDKASKLPAKDQPYLDRYPALKAWLFDKHDGRCMNQVPIETAGGKITFFEKWILPWTEVQRSGHTHIVLVEIRSHGEGWDVWTAPVGILVPEYLAEVDRRLEQKA